MLKRLLMAAVMWGVGIQAANAAFIISILSQNQREYYGLSEVGAFTREEAESLLYGSGTVTKGSFNWRLKALKPHEKKTQEDIMQHCGRWGVANNPDAMAVICVPERAYVFVETWFILMGKRNSQYQTLPVFIVATVLVEPNSALSLIRAPQDIDYLVSVLETIQFVENALRPARVNNNGNADQSTEDVAATYPCTAQPELVATSGFNITVESLRGLSREQLKEVGRNLSVDEVLRWWASLEENNLNLVRR